MLRAHLFDCRSSGFIGADRHFYAAENLRAISLIGLLFCQLVGPCETRVQGEYKAEHGLIESGTSASSFETRLFEALIRMRSCFPWRYR